MDGNIEVGREYRRWRKTSRGRVVLMCVVMGNSVLQIGLHSRIPVPYRLLMLALIAVVSVWAFLTARRGLTSVGADGITVRGAFLVRRRAWHDIYDLRVEHLPNKNTDARLWTWLYGNDGRRLRLPNVDDWQLPELRAEIDELRIIAAQHRGMAWELRAEVEELIGLRAVRRTARVRASIGALLVLFSAAGYLAWTVSDHAGHRLFAVLLLLWAPLVTYVLLLGLFRLFSSRAPAHA